MSTVVQPVDLEPARVICLRAALRKVFSFPMVLGGLLFAGVFITVRLNLRSVATQSPGSAQTSIIEGDTWWHITAGDRILRTHTWPTKESDSFTANGNEWIAYEWLGEVAMAWAEHHGGLRALAGLLVLLAGTILALAYYSACLRTGNAEASFLACAVLLPLGVISFSLRPQLLGYIFFLAALICLERFRLGRQKHLWMLPAVFLLWVNTHPTFIYGFLLLALYWAAGLTSFSAGGLRAEPWKPAERCHLAVVGLLCVLTLPLNPYGARLVGYLLHLTFFQPANFASIQEWRPLPFDQFHGKLFLVVLLVFVVALLWVRPRYRLEEMGLLLLAIAAACSHLRFLILFAVIFAPFLAGLLARSMPPHHPGADRHVVNAVLMALIAAGLVHFFPSRWEVEGAVAQGFPVAAVEYLRRHPAPGPMFNEDLWGAYLTRSLGAGHKVFIDGRVDAYEPAGVFSDYVRITGLDPEALFLLRKYGVEACLIERQSLLATFLSALPDWELRFSDNLSSLFVRKRSAAPLATCGFRSHIRIQSFPRKRESTPIAIP